MAGWQPMKSERLKRAVRRAISRLPDGVSVTIVESVPARSPEQRAADARDAARLDADLRLAVRARGKAGWL